MQNKPPLPFPLRALAHDHLPSASEWDQMFKRGQLPALRDLVALSLGDWIQLTTTQLRDGGIGFPAATPGPDDSHKAKEYARSLAESVSRSFPTAVIANRVARGASPSDANRVAHLVAFLSTNPRFDVANSDLSTYLRESPSETLTGVDDPEGLKRDIKALQRMYTITGSSSAFDALLDKGYRSAHSIASQGSVKFLAKMAPRMGLKRALTIFRQATRSAASRDFQ